MPWQYVGRDRTRQRNGVSSTTIRREPVVLPVGAFPFDDGRDLAWRSTVDDWLRRLGEYLFSTVRFRVGLVGWTDGLDDGTDDLLERGVPEERWVGYLVPSGDSLTWYPPNQRADAGGRTSS